jgi:hypothetical protein
MVKMNSDLRLKKDVELSQAAYLKFHSAFNTELRGARADFPEKPPSGFASPRMPG